jgi:hypothetical protein
VFVHVRLTEADFEKLKLDADERHLTVVDLLSLTSKHIIRDDLYDAVIDGGS